MGERGEFFYGGPRGKCHPDLEFMKGRSTFINFIHAGNGNVPGTTRHDQQTALQPGTSKAFKFYKNSKKIERTMNNESERKEERKEGRKEESQR